MLAALSNVPLDERSLNIWSFHNADSHSRIIRAIFMAGGGSLTQYPLDPVSIGTLPAWLRLHQTEHDDMNANLHLGGNNLTDVDWENADQRKSWISLHAHEHRAAENKLGIG